jgi:hypothetical protein
MRIAYMNTDEVNEAMAEQMAAACGAVVRTVLPKDPAPDGQFDAILYNVDDVPREGRSVLLEELRLGKPHSPAAVHGYDLTDEQVKTLGQSGTAAARRLSANLVRRLCRAARKHRDSAPPDENATELTSVTLAKERSANLIRENSGQRICRTPR